MNHLRIRLLRAPAFLDGLCACELVQTLMALMMAGAPWTLFEKSVYIHPTLTEGFFTLMDNVKDVEVKLADELFFSPDSDGAESELVDDFFSQPELS